MKLQHVMENVFTTVSVSMWWCCLPNTGKLIVYGNDYEKQSITRLSPLIWVCNSNNNTNNGGLNDSFGTLSEQADNEAEGEVFKSESYCCNDFYQMCTHDKFIAGGGGSWYPKNFGNGLGIISPEDIGFGLLFENGSLMEGSSPASLTYRSPPLSDIHKDGSKFELVNFEVWGCTPCRTEEEARILEYRNMFFKRHSSGPI